MAKGNTLKSSFKLPNGLSAKTCLFENAGFPPEVATELRERGWPGHGERANGWAVVEVTVAKEKVYLVYCTCIHPKRMAEALQKHPELLSETHFVAYRNQVHRWSSRSAKLIIKAIEQNISPSVIPLIADAARD